MTQTEQHFRLEQFRLTKGFLEAYFNCSKELRLLITLDGLTVHLSPQANYEVSHERMTNSRLDFTCEILFHGFKPTPITLKKREAYFKELRESMSDDFGGIIIIVHDAGKSYYHYRSPQGTYDIEASESLTHILRSGKFPD